MIDIRVEGLVKSFDLEKKILDGLTFQIDTGERVGLLGRNGAGKTTLFKILTGELDYDSGTVQIASGRRVGLISQIPVYPEGYTVEDVLQTAFARMFRMKDEMDALALRMEQGASDEATLRRYGELNARFEGLGGWDTDTAALLGGAHPFDVKPSAPLGYTVTRAVGRAHQPSGLTGHGVAGGIPP